ncbi:MAG: TetR/AcrR family transcriptional regulator [Anaerolineaceae bacterium]|nr:TetR/AcrR family transcriptional regulator [Anaerolineaceae bacterium]
MSPRTAQANQQVRDERQEQILMAALRVFAQQGFAATKMSDIAAAAGVSYGLVAHYFGKKDEIYSAVIARAFAGVLQLFEDSLMRSGTPWEHLCYVCEKMLVGIQETPEYVLLVNQARTNPAVSAGDKALFRRYENRSLDLQLELIRQAQAAGQVRAGDPLELAIAFSAIIQGLAILSFYERAQSTQSQPVDFLTHFPDTETVLRLMKP